MPSPFDNIEPQGDANSRITHMTGTELRRFCETHPTLHAYFDKDELDKLQSLRFSGPKVTTLTTDQWIRAGLPRSTAVALEAFINRVLSSLPIASGSPQFILRAQRDEHQWFKSLFNMTKNFKKDSDFYTTMALQKVPLFTPPELRSTRLVMDVDDMSFRYYGRTLFKRISDKVKDMRSYGGRFLYVHGTSGAGKSHVLAAFAASLVAQGERVVFLADCRMLAPEPISSIRSALHLAFADEDEVVSEIMKIKDKDSLQEFCRLIGRRKLIFIIDQVDALDPVADSSDKVTEEQKCFTRTILDTITRYHFKVHSASGNYRHGEGDRLRLSGHERIEVQGGLDVLESRQWWESNKLGKRWSELLLPQHKKDIEIYTGMVPTLLEHLLVASPADLGPDGGILEPMDDAIRDSQYMGSKRVRDGMINYINDCSTVSDWRGMVSDFMVTETEKVKNTSREQPFFRAIECCVSESPVDDMARPLIDHRFMFVAEGVGRCSGGVLVRKIIATFLRARSMSLFSGTRWYSALTGSLSSTVLGFLVEQMTLSCIAVHGSDELDIPASSASCLFPGSTPPLDSGEHVFAIPTKFNFPYMDAIYWKVLGKAGNGIRTVRFVGIQVTLQDWKAHSETEGPFLEAASKWVSDRGWAGEWEIVWLVESRKQGQEKESIVEAETEKEYQKRTDTSLAEFKKRKLGSGKSIEGSSPKTHCRRPKFVRRIITINEVSHRIGTKLKAVRTANESELVARASVKDLSVYAQPKVTCHEGVDDDCDCMPTSDDSGYVLFSI